MNMLKLFVKSPDENEYTNNTGDKANKNRKKEVHYDIIPLTYC